METPNIQLYNFLRYDFHLTDIKSVEFMNVLDKEYKSGVKHELVALEKRMNEGFESQAKQFNDLKDDFRELRSDLKVEFARQRNDMQMALDRQHNETQLEFARQRNDFREGLAGLRSDLRVEIKDSKVESIRWAIGLFFALVAMLIVVYLKK